MSVLRGLEGRLERVFEGVFGRAFRTHVQPVELARKLAKEMDEHRSVSVSRVYVPNEYTLYLSPADRAQFASYEGSLIGELQEYLAEHARREGYALLSPPRVLLTVDDDLAVGEFGIATRLDESSPAAAPVVAPPVTMVYRPDEQAPKEAPAPPPAATLTVSGRRIPLSAARVVLGRSRDADVQVDDANVSRLHCEIVRDGAASWVVADLGSTNGTELNGKRVDRAALTDGDRIVIGGTTIVFGRDGR